MKMKKLSIMLVCVMLVGLLGGCGNSFDAAGYITAILDNSYKNDSSKFVSMKIGTAEEAAETYETAVDGEVETLVLLSGASKATDAEFDQLKGIYEDIYSQTRYTVDGAEKQDDGSYVVTVTYEQIKVFGPAIEAYLAEIDRMSEEYLSTGVYPSDETLMEAYIECFANAAANATFGESASTTIRVELVNQVWQPNENDVVDFGTKLFDVEELINALQ